MKKLLVLLMVLGLATSAQAALSLSLSATTVLTGDTVTVSVISNDAEPWTWQFLLSEETYAWSDPIAASYNGTRTAGGAITVLAAAGNNATVEANPGYAAMVQLNVGGTAPAPVAGTQFTVSILGAQAGTIYIDLMDASTVSSMVGGYLTLVVVPEPITIALLGLGGLFLRRRK